MPSTPSWHYFRADCARYREDSWLSRRFWWITERSIWAVAIYRLGRALKESLPSPLAGPVLTVYSLVVSPIIQILTSIELPLGTQIGPGLRIYHGTGLVVSGDTVIGERCTLRQGVTVGTYQRDGGSPVLGDNVDIGVQASVLGTINIGHGARIGAGAVVIKDVPVGATAVGVPARIVTRKTA